MRAPRFPWLVAACLSLQVTTLAQSQPRRDPVPERIVNVEAIYPQIAQSARVSGRVVGEVEIAPNGTVVSSRILCSIPLLDRALLDAVQQWRYRPQQRTANIRTTVWMKFSLDDENGRQQRLERCTPLERPTALTRVAPTTLRQTSGDAPRPTPPQLQLSAAFAKRNDLFVLAELSIAPEGYVYDARIIKSEPYIDEAVLDAVHTWSFEPTIAEGKEIAVATFRTFKFQVDPSMDNTTGADAKDAASDAVELKAIQDKSLIAYRAGGEIPQPTKLRHVHPIYPGVAVSIRARGVMLFELTVGRNGHVLDARFLDSKVPGAPLLRDAAVKAVRQWRYQPSLLEGAPVPAITTVAVGFSLDDWRALGLSVFQDVGANRATQQERFDSVILHPEAVRLVTSSRLEQLGAAADTARYQAATAWIDERLILASLVKPRGTISLEFFSFTMLPIAKRALLAGILIERDATNARRWNPDLFGALESVRAEYNRTLAEYGPERVDAALEAIRPRLRPSFIGTYFEAADSADNVYRSFLRHLDPAKAAQTEASTPPPVTSRRGMPADRPAAPTVRTERADLAPPTSRVERTDLASPTEGELAGLDLASRMLTLSLRDGSSATFSFDDGTTVSALDGNARLLVRSEGRALDGVRAVRLQWAPDAVNPSRRLIARITVTAVR